MKAAEVNTDDQPSAAATLLTIDGPTDAGGPLRLGGDDSAGTAEVAASVHEGRAFALARPVSRSRLLSWLVMWDALVPAALLVVAGRFEGVFGPPLNGGAADITDSLVLVLAIISPIGLAMAGAYHHRRRRGGSRLLFALRLGVVGMVISWIALISSAIMGWPIDFAQMLALSALLPVGWLLGRWACDRHPATGAERILLVGSGTVARRVLDLTLRHRERRLDVVGRIEVDPAAAVSADAPGPPVLGGLSRLPEIVGTHAIDRVIVAFAPGATPSSSRCSATASEPESRWTWCRGSSTWWARRRGRTRSAASLCSRFPAEA